MRKAGLILIAASLIVTQSASNTLPSYTFSDTEEYQIYSSMITIFVTDKSKPLLVIDRTSDCPSPEDLQDALQQEREPYLAKATLLDFKRKNAQPREIPQALDLPFSYQLLSRDSYQEIFKEGCEGWCTFYESYPEGSGILSLSRVGFNKTGTQALVYIAYSCGGLCGHGGYMVLAKEDGLWKIKKGMASWRS